MQFVDARLTENGRLRAETVEATYDGEVVASIPAGRWGTPHDLGLAARYRADPTRSYHTGSELLVDGGYATMPPYLAIRAAKTAGARE